MDIWCEMCIKKEMTLNDKQFRFTFMVGLLIIYIYFKGYTATFGDAYDIEEIEIKCPKCNKKFYQKGRHKSGSLHYLRLAIDFNLFKDGEYLTTTKSHEVLGKFWELIGGSWGGRYDDGNHYSLEHNGRK